MIGKWLAARKTFPALQLAALAPLHIGQRPDLHILDVAIEPRDAADALRADTAFAIKRQSIC